MRNLIIIGGGGHAKVVADIAIQTGYNVLGFLDDNSDVCELLGFSRLGNIADCVNYGKEVVFVIAIGNNKIRKEIFSKYDLNYVTLIHPTAIIGPQVSVGAGTVVMAGAVINASAKIGVQSIINTACVVEHDVVIGDFTMLAPHSTVCGFTKIGNNCWVGAGATINNVIKICDDCIIGAGATVIRSIEKAGTYVGTPATKVR